MLLLTGKVQLFERLLSTSGDGLHLTRVETCFQFKLQYIYLLSIFDEFQLNA